MISLDDLRAFLAVARHESFVEAAEELCITPPALSRRIKKLEKFVGDPLFERTTQMVAITSSGQILLERAEIVVREFENFKDFSGRFAREHLVKVRFGCIWSAAGSVVPSLIREYAQINKDAEFEVRDADANTVFQWVQERQLDFGISMRPEDTKSLHFTLLCKDPIMLACPPGHRFFGRTTLDWSDLKKANMEKLDWGVLSYLAMGSFLETLERAEIPHERGKKIDHLATQLGFLEAHQRAMIMPLLGISLSRAPDIRSIPIASPTLSRDIGIVTLPNYKPSRAVASFLDHIQENFRAHYQASVQRFCD